MPWLELRVTLPVGALSCVVGGPNVEPRAEALCTTALQPLLAAGFHLVVAVQDQCRALTAYENLAKRLAETITIPEFT